MARSSLATADSPRPRGRGRASGHQQEVASPRATRGRGRGRPSKAAKEADSAGGDTAAGGENASKDDAEEGVNRLLSMLEEDEDDNSQEAADEEVVKPKAKGRPRKVQQANSEPSQQEPERAPEEVSRKRRRPSGTADAEPSSEASKKPRVTRTAEEAAAVEGGTYSWCADPADARLTVDGAVCDEHARLKLRDYMDLKASFPGEAAPAKHPDPSKPGLRVQELPGGTAVVNLESLSSWQDDKGAGWKVRRASGGSVKAETRWFGAKAWGSWRLAFLLAKVQREVWVRAATQKRHPSAPSASASSEASSRGSSSSSSGAVPPAGSAAAPPEAASGKRILSGKEEWHIFSPKEIDDSLCLARTWNDGQGGQCSERVEAGSKLCDRHMRMDARKHGLTFGLVDGPIPERALKDFQWAAVRASGGRRRTVRPKAKASKGSDPQKKGSALKLRRQAAKKQAQQRKQEKKRLKSEKQDKQTRASRSVPGDAAMSETSSKPAEAAQGGEKRTKGVFDVKVPTGFRIHRPRIPPTTQRSAEDAARQEAKAEEKLAERLQKAASAGTTASQPGAPAVETGEWRSRRPLRAAMSKAEARQFNRRRMNAIDTAMDQAMDEQRDRALGPSVLRAILDKKGCIQAASMVKALDLMKSVETVQGRLGFIAVLRRTVDADASQAAAFVQGGGLETFRTWLQAFLPPACVGLGLDERREYEEVVLECLAFLQHLPVTQEILRQCAIGPTLAALLRFCPRTAESVEKVIALWKAQVRPAAPATQASTSTPASVSQRLHSKQPPPATSSAASSSRPSPEKARAAAPGKEATKRVQPAQPAPAPAAQAAAPSREATQPVQPAPTRQPPASAAVSGPVTPASYAKAIDAVAGPSPLQMQTAASLQSARPPAARPKHLWRSRGEQEKADALEAMLREISILGDILEQEDKPRAVQRQEEKPSAPASASAELPRAAATIDLCAD